MIAKILQIVPAPPNHWAITQHDDRAEPGIELVRYYGLIERTYQGEDEPRSQLVPLTFQGHVYALADSDATITTTIISDNEQDALQAYRAHDATDATGLLARRKEHREAEWAKEDAAEDPS